MTYNRIFFVKNHFLFALLLFFLALAACEDEPGCVSDDTNEVKIGFFKIDDTTKRNADDVFVLEVIPIGSESILVDTSATVRQRIDIPLNPSEDVTTFNMVLASGEVKTLVLRYKREQTLISPECGPTQRYYDLAVDRSTFDNFRVVERELGKVKNMNIELYTCQDTFYTQEVVINFLEQDTAGIRRDSLFVQSIRDDSGQLLANENDTIVDILRVPINPQAESVTLTFDLLAHDGEPARTETLAFSYRDDTVRFAANCRLQTRYFGLDVLNSTFDSLHIENRELAVDVPLNIKIINQRE